MAKQRHESKGQVSSATSQSGQPSKPARRASSGLPWHPAWRWLASALIVLHLLAVFVAPWDLSTEPALPPGYVPPRDNSGRPMPPPPMDSDVWQKPVVPRALRRFFNHYLNLAYLNHGYQFFAPDPAGTHVIDYQVTRSDGSVTKGRFPDLKEQWPRLLYHRHMMLAEQTEMMGPESGQHYADHLAKIYGGRCRMQWIIHLLLSPQQVKDGIPLDDPSTYRVLASVESRVNGESPVSIPGAGQ